MWAYRPVTAESPLGADPDLEAIEGEPRLVAHLRRERDPAVAKRKKDEVLRATGRLACEGTAIFVRDGLEVDRIALQSKGSYVAAVRLPSGESPTLVASIHVGPPAYKKHLCAVVDGLSVAVDGQRFVVGGDLNAARHWDDVYGGRWYTNYFDDLAQRGFHDCHWAQHGQEVQSFWGRQAREAYQCDHLFVDAATAPQVSDCAIVAMEKLEESQRVAEERRRKRAEQQKHGTAEAVAHPLHKADKNPPAFVPVSADTPTRKQLPS